MPLSDWEDDDLVRIRPGVVRGICAMLYQPGASVAVGFAGLVCQRTAKARFPSTATKRWQSQPAAAKRQLPRDETVEVYFNDTPLLRKISYNENGNAFTASYEAYDNEDTTLFAEDGGFLHFNKFKTTQPNGFNPHTETLCTSDGSLGQRQVWLDATLGSVCVVTFTLLTAPTSASNTGGIQVWRYNSGNESFDGLPGADPGFLPFVATTTVYTISLTLSDDYSFQIINAEDDVLVTGFEVSFSTSCGIWAHLPMEGFLDDLYRYSRGKITMLSHDILIKNGASTLNDQGYITVARLQDTTDWYSMIITGADNSVFDQVADYGDDSVRYVDTFKRGLHSFMLPGMIGWEKLAKVAELNPKEAISYDMTYRRDKNYWAPLIIAISSINPEGVTSITGCDALFVENQWFEFTTSNKHEAAALSLASPVEWLQSMWVLGKLYIARDVDGDELELMSRQTDPLTQYDNPGHIKRMWDLFRTNMGRAMPYVAPVLSKAAKMAGNALGDAMGDESVKRSAAAAAQDIVRALTGGGRTRNALKGVTKL